MVCYSCCEYSSNGSEKGYVRLHFAYYKDGNKLEVYFLEKDGNNLKQTLLNVGTLPQNAEGYSDAKTLTGDLTSIGDKVGFIGFKFVGSETRVELIRLTIYM